MNGACGGTVTTTATTTTSSNSSGSSNNNTRTFSQLRVQAKMPCPSPTGDPAILLTGGKASASISSAGPPLITIMHPESPQAGTKVLGSGGVAHGSSAASFIKTSAFLSSEPHVITVTVSEAETGGDMDGGGGPAPTIITATTVPHTYDEDYPMYSGDAMYTTASVYTATPQPQFVTEVTAGSALSGGTYIVQPSTAASVQPGDHEAQASVPMPKANPQTSDESAAGSITFVVSGADADVQTNSIAQANRVSPASVQWLKDNYEPAEGVSLPRSTLYNYYIRHCADHKLDPVNAASFGKLIRSVFMGLRTRRLGTRGNSKYHYYGIRVKPSSPLFSLNDDGGQSPPHSSADSPSAKKVPGSQGNGSAGKTGSSYKDDGSYERSLPADASPQTIANQQYLGDSDMLCFPDIEWGSDPLPPGVTVTHVNTFSDLYREHCSTLQDAVHALKFSAVESIWKKFWLMGGNNNNNNNDSMDVKEPFLSHLDEDDENNLAARIPHGPLQALMRATPVLEFIQTADYTLYQCLVDVLIPDVLRSIPTNLTQAIRNFAKSLEGWLSQALLGCPAQLQHLKVVAVSSLGQMLRRYTSLNHLAQAARAVLHNTEQIQQMLQDLNRVDFHNVHEQASWVCGCDEAIVSRLETDFKLTLQKPSSLEDWAKWLNKLVDDILEPHHAQRDFPLQARQFLLKWSFYSSMVIRDLTLRSAASFGSFHLIRLLYDEYMFYVVERRVANVLGRTPIAVMSEFLSSRRECSEEAPSSTITNGEHHGQVLNCTDAEKYEEPKLKKLKYEPA